MKNNKIHIEIILGTPPEEKMEILKNLYTSIFKDACLLTFKNRIHKKKNILSLIAFKNNIPVGFKIGYELNTTTFYSWLGGILFDYRKQGIAIKLAKKQENCVRNKQYTSIQTKSTNRFKPMLILNLKNGFDIIETYRDSQGEIKIIFEKHIYPTKKLNK